VEVGLSEWLGRSKEVVERKGGGVVSKTGSGRAGELLDGSKEVVEKE
jgi:hypothetical protein